MGFGGLSDAWRQVSQTRKVKEKHPKVSSQRLGWGTGKLSTLSTKDHLELWSRLALWVSGMKARGPSADKEADMGCSHASHHSHSGLLSTQPTVCSTYIIITEKYFIFIYVYVCIWLYARIWRTEEAVRSPVVGVTGSWELSDMGKQEQQMLLTREPPLQPSRNRIELKTNCG